MGIIIAEGQLYHMFHGAYMAAVALGFSDERAALDGLRALGAGWKVGRTTPRGLLWTGNSGELEILKGRFEVYNLTVLPCGRKECRGQCHNAEIDSVAHSVDFGPVFHLSIPCIPAEQMEFSNGNLSK